MMYQKLIVAPQRAWIALVTALILAVIHQYLFFGHMWGVSYPVFVILLYLYMYTYAGDRLRPGSWISRLMMTAIILLSLSYALFANILFYLLNLIVVPTLIFTHMAYMLSERRPAWYQPKLIKATLEHIFIHLLAHLPTPLRMLYGSLASRMEQERRRTLGRILLGVLAALPLLCIVVILLTSADRMFGELLSSLPSWLTHLSYGTVFWRTVWVLIMTFVLFAYLWGFVKPVQEKARPAADPLVTEWNVQLDPPKPIRFDPLIISTILVLVNLVYLLFVWLQFSYLFGAGQGELPDGSTYAEYARSGFGELVIVTAINFTLLWAVLYGTAQASSRLTRMNNWLLWILVICSAVMLGSAFTRLILYEQAYGYTITRFLVHAFMLFLGLLFILAGLRIAFRHLPLGRCILVLGLLAYVILNYTGMERWIAHSNIERYAESGELDTDYLLQLSADTIPMLLNFSEQHPQLGLESRLKERKQYLLEEDLSWQSFNWSTYQAIRALRLSHVDSNYKE